MEVSALRTSRIQPVASSTYSKQYLHTNNEQVFRVMDEGRGNHPFSKNPREQRKNRSKSSAVQSRLSNTVLNRNAKRMFIVGQQFDGESMEKMRKRLLQHKEKIKRARNKKVLIRAYRTSI
jgi:hypothetical protein